MKQEVRLKLDVSLTIDAKHGTDELRDIIERGIRQMFPNNHKKYNAVSFAEESDIYGDDGIKWRALWSDQAHSEPHDYLEPIEINPMLHGYWGKGEY
jgi:hypothetical protein